MSRSENMLPTITNKQSRKRHLKESVFRTFAVQPHVSDKLDEAMAGVQGSTWQRDSESGVQARELELQKFMDNDDAIDDLNDLSDYEAPLQAEETTKDAPAILSCARADEDNELLLLVETQSVPPQTFRNCISSLPDQLLDRVFSYLGVSQVLKVRCVSRRFYVRGDSSILWQELLSAETQDTAIKCFTGDYTARRYVLNDFSAPNRDQSLFSYAHDAQPRSPRTPMCPQCGLIQARHNSEECEMCGTLLPLLGDLEWTDSRGAGASTPRTSSTGTSQQGQKLQSTMTNVSMPALGRKAEEEKVKVDGDASSRASSSSGSLTPKGGRRDLFATRKHYTHLDFTDWYFLAKVRALDQQQQSAWNCYSSGWAWLRRSFRQIAEQVSVLQSSNEPLDDAMSDSVSVEVVIFKAMSKLYRNSWYRLYESIALEFRIRCELLARSLFRNPAWSSLENYSMSANYSRDTIEGARSPVLARSTVIIGNDQRAEKSPQEENISVGSILQFLTALVRIWQEYVAWSMLVDRYSEAVNFHIEGLRDRSQTRRDANMPYISDLALISFREVVLMDVRVYSILKLAVIVLQAFLRLPTHPSHFNVYNILGTDINEDHYLAVDLRTQEISANLQATMRPGSGSEDITILNDIKQRLIDLYDLTKIVMLSGFDDGESRTKVRRHFSERFVSPLRSLVVRFAVSRGNLNEWLLQDSAEQKAPGEEVDFCVGFMSNRERKRRKRKRFSEGTASASSQPENIFRNKMLFNNFLKGIAR